MLELAQYSIGVGDRFAHQARAQLAACAAALDRGIPVTPVWNKSFREHAIVGSHPSGVRTAADEAVKGWGWTRPYHVDADHINYDTVSTFLDSSDFFTLDVAAFIGKPVDASEARRFADRHPELMRDGVSKQIVESVANRYLGAVAEAGRIYRAIATHKGSGTFITEVSMDETGTPQRPEELLVILAALADEGIPAQTIAPKFTGRFNKGVDFVGDPTGFEREFNADLDAIKHAVSEYALPQNLKFSIHSGSDKFCIYAAIRRALGRTGAGVHLKTAGTTWLEELIGLAEAGAEGLSVAKEVYAGAYLHREELCLPYAEVIDIDPARLPHPSTVDAWSGEEYAGALRHEPACPLYNLHFRQLLHVGYKVAAQLGTRYTRMLVECEQTISRNVTENLLNRHIVPVFGVSQSVRPSAYARVEAVRSGG